VARSRSEPRHFPSGGWREFGKVRRGRTGSGGRDREKLRRGLQIEGPEGVGRLRSDRKHSVAGELLGSAVAISGNTIVAGAPNHTVTGNLKQGAAYTFAAAGPAQRNEIKIVTDPVGATAALFGFSVAIQGDTIVVGAAGKSSASVFFRPAPAPPPPGVAPHLTHVTESHSTWRAGNRLATLARAKRAPVGTRFSFVLDQPARVNLAFVQDLSGRKVRAACVAPTRANRHKPACERQVRTATLSITGHRGINQLAFQGRVSRSKTLRPGRYTVVITATNRAGQRSAPRSLGFTIVT
jgi:FG-GAP repeat